MIFFRSCKHSSLKNTHCLFRSFSNITGYEKADRVIDKLTLGRAEKWLRNYEDFIGLTEVREAQRNVIEVSRFFNDFKSYQS